MVWSFSQGVSRACDVAPHHGGSAALSQPLNLLVQAHVERVSAGETAPPAASFTGEVDLAPRADTRTLTREAGA